MIQDRAIVTMAANTNCIDEFGVLHFWDTV